MGRGRIGPIDQSQKKPKIRKRKDKERGEMQCWRFDGPNDDKISLFLPHNGHE